MTDSREPWHLDKRVPVALIFAIVLQTGAGFWWASSINERVAALEGFRRDSKDVAADIAVMKAEITNVKAILQRIEAQLATDRRAAER